MTTRADLRTVFARHRRLFGQWLCRILRLQPPDPLQLLLRAHELRMDAERREFAHAAVDAMQAVPSREGQGFDVFAFMRIQHMLRPIFDEFYGRYPGDLGSRFGVVMLEQARAARWLAHESQVQDVERRLQPHPDLLRAIREAA